MWIQACIFSILCTADAQERDYYTISSIKEPENVVLEVGGIAVMGPDEVMISTRRGEVYLIRELNSSEPKWTLFAEGLQEPLGLLDHDGWIYTVQRGELSRMREFCKQYEPLDSGSSMVNLLLNERRYSWLILDTNYWAH